MKTYFVKKTDINNVPINSKEWEKAEIANIDNIAPGSEEIPNTTARMLFSNGGITLKMETDEKPLLAEIKERDGAVCTDSCMEFFIRPETDEKYLNFEINPIKTLHLGLGKDRYGRTHMPEIYDEFDIDCSFEDDKWQMKIYIPFEVIDKIYGSHTNVFYGNIYKCGENTEKEHYATWNVVEVEKADFHRPEYFGKIVLE